MNFNKVAVASGALLGSAQTAVADVSNATDSIVDILPVIIELAVVIALLGVVMSLLKKM